MNLDSAVNASAIGVRIAGTGSFIPEKVLTNADFEEMVDTSDEWIVKRTGIHERRVVDPLTQSTFTMSLEAITRALDDAGMKGSDLDLIILATVSMEMTCPSTACRIAAEIGAEPAGAFDLMAACSGFVYAMNLADTLIRSGRHKKIGVIGCDTMSSIIDYNDRGSSILFGDAAGAAVLVADESPKRGCIYQRIQADGNNWHSLYIPKLERDVYSNDPIENKLGAIRMQGRDVYKFAVSKFQWAIKDALENSGLTAEEISAFICHQSNLRIIDSAVEKLNLPKDRVFINIDKYGNSSAGSVGLCLDEMRRAGRIPEGEPFVMVAFGGGLTWASSVWIA